MLCKCKKNPDILSNHTWDHVQPARSRRKATEIEKTNIESADFRNLPSYVRPPFGAWIKDMDFVTMLPVFWDVDTLDWKSKTSILSCL